MSKLKDDNIVEITSTIGINKKEIKFSYIRSPGPGGQNVNKVATGVQLRFNISNSFSLPEEIKQRLILNLKRKITLSGDIIIKASRYRAQNLNKEDVLRRLQALLRKSIKIKKKRKKTTPSNAAKEQRLAQKKKHAKNKALRNKNYLD